MKQLQLIIGILLLAAHTATAADIGLSTARKAAEIFMTQGSALTRGTSCKLTLVSGDENSLTRSGEKPAYYIFNSDRGFVIISAIEASRPILGYSFENTFGPIDEMPENLAGLLEGYKHQINMRRNSGKEATADEIARWNALLSAERNAISNGGGKDLQTPDWGQGAPFNGKCPADSDGSRCLVGCTSTAMSELLYYYRYPTAGTGTLPGYTSTKNGNSIKIPSITLGEAYKWDKMLPKYSGVNYTNEQADAVATLCYHVAVMNQASFGSGATSASTTSGAKRLPQYFGYDKGFTKYSASYFSYDEWFELLKNSIDNGNPVLYSGDSESGSGHAFIIDGYDESGRALINFGWNASSNGYYEIGSFQDYVRDNCCWINVRPDAGGSDTGYMALYARSSSGHTGIAYENGTPYPGGKISVLFGGIYWRSNGCSFTGQVNLKLMSRDGRDKGWVYSGITRSSTNPLKSGSIAYYTSPITLTIPSDVTIERGDYIAAYYKESSSTVWKPVLYEDSELSVIGKIYCHIADFTSMTFDSNTRELLFETFSDADFTITDQSGNAVTEGIICFGGKISIDTSVLAKGTYKATFTAGGQSTTVSFKI